MDQKAKDNYLELNRWCRAQLFNEGASGKRVFLDLDSFRSSNFQESSNGTEPPFEKTLLEIVAQIIVTKSYVGERIFRFIDTELVLWKAHCKKNGYTIDNPPPLIPLLLAFVLAAERMGEDGRNSLDYYSQLVSVLSLPPNQRNDLQSEFRGQVIQYFQELADWLGRFEGLFGIPTFPDRRTNQEYVEVAIRQALIRSADRSKLEQLFKKSNFFPNQQIPPDEMISYIQEWEASYAPLSVYFWRHFSNQKTRASIAKAVSEELASWDGSAQVRLRSESEQFNALACATFTRGIFGDEFKLELLAEIPADLINSTWAAEEFGSAKTTFEYRSAGLFALNVEGVNPHSLFFESFRATNSENKHQITRRSEPLIVMTKNSISGNFDEVERPSQGQESLILAINLQADTLESLEHYLAAHARQGFKKYSHNEISDIPSGWLLYSDLQIISTSSETKFTELFPQLLLPVTRTMLQLEGGIGLRDNTNTYIQGYLPKVTAISSTYLVLRLKISSFRAGDEGQVFSTNTGSLRVDLNSIEGLDESFQVQLFEGIDAKPVRTSRLLIKSSYRIQNIRSIKYIKHEISEKNPLAVLSGIPIEVGQTSQVVLKDLFIGSVISPPQVTAPPERLVVNQSNSGLMRAGITKGKIASCVNRGSHKWHLEKTTAEKRKWDAAHCTDCKKQTRFRTTAPSKQSGNSTSRNVEPQIDLLSELLVQQAPKIEEAIPFDLESVRLVLRLVGSGNYPKLQKLIGQFSAVSREQDLILLLESMSLINTVRDRYGKIETWAVNPELTLTSENTSVSGSSDDQGLSTRHDISRHLVSICPNLSQVAAAISFASIASFVSIERFELTTLKFQKVTAVEGPGAYRFTTLTGNLYAYIGESGSYLANLQFGTPQLVKHLHALYSGKGLLSYDPITSRVYVPIGCELPGVFGKVLGILSQSPPAKVPRDGWFFWEFVDVPKDIIVELTSKLGN
jgi:hypothetical protein